MNETRRNGLLRSAYAWLSVLPALGLLVYVLWIGIPITVNWLALAPGIWGYVATAALLAGTVPIPLLLMVILSGGSLRASAIRCAPLVVVSIGTIFVAGFAGTAHWPAWVAAVVVLAAVWFVRTANRAILLAPIR